MTYRAGELDQLVTFRREVRTDDGMGGSVSTWEDIATNVWAKVRPLRGGERENHDRLESPANYLIVVYARDDIDESCVAVWNGIQFNIRFVKHEPRQPFLELECEKGVTI